MASLLALVVLTGWGSSLASGSAVVGTATQITQPSGAVGATSTKLDAVTCTSPGSCVAVGFYSTSGGERPMAATESSGTWGAASAVALPGGSNEGALSGVACTSAGNCVAVGYYDAGDGSQIAAYATETDGSWGTLAPFAMPADAASLDGAYTGEYVDTAQAVSCTSAGNCVATGGYTTETSTNSVFVANDVSGTWQTAQALMLPDGTTGGEQAAGNGISCDAPGSCTLVGDWGSTGPNELPIAAIENDGTWAQATQVPLSGYLNSYSPSISVLEGVSCTGAGDCEAVGYSGSSSTSLQTMAASESGGSWAPATLVQLGAGLGTYFAVNELLGVSCASQGNCVAVGYYDTAPYTSQTLIASEDGGTWGLAGLAAVPSNAIPPPANSGNTADGVSCTGVDACTYVGGYVNADPQTQPYAAVTISKLAITSASLAGGSLGTPYTQALAAAGGTGSYAWSVSAGNLPPGLALNSATGVISGTPTAAWSARFTISASDAGPPAQSASATFGIVIGEPALQRVTRKKAELLVSLFCSAPAGEQCSGTLELTAVKHLRGKRVVAVTARVRRKPKPRKLQFTIATQSYTLAGGMSSTYALSFGGIPKRLRSSSHATVTLLANGVGAPLAAERVTV